MGSKARKLDKWYDTHIERFLPQYAFFSLVSCFLVNCLVYWTTQQIMEDEYHYDFTTDLDRMIPFQPQWVSIYVLSFLFWVVNYVIIGRQDKTKWYQFVTADILAKLICGVFFVLLPTTNVRPDIVGTGVWSWLMKLIYSLDAPFNLFPSIHCLSSWLCYIGIRGNKNIPVWYRGFSLIFAILICLSTQFTKQHYLVDLFGGIILAEGTLFFARHTNLYKLVQSMFEKLDYKCFGVNSNEQKKEIH